MENDVTFHDIIALKHKSIESWKLIGEFYALRGLLVLSSLHHNRMAVERRNPLSVPSRMATDSGFLPYKPRGWKRILLPAVFYIIFNKFYS